MLFNEFLKLVLVLKTLYGREVAEKFFDKNISNYYDLDNASLSKIKGQPHNG